MKINSVSFTLNPFFSLIFKNVKNKKMSNTKTTEAKMFNYGNMGIINDDNELLRSLID